MNEKAYNKKSLLSSGNFYFRMGDYKESLLFYNKILNECPDLKKIIDFNKKIATKKIIVKNEDNTQIKNIPSVIHDSSHVAKKKRIAVFASYSYSEVVEEYVVYYLSELKKVVDDIIFIADNFASEIEKEKISHIVSYSEFSRHGEYDFGSYKRGLSYCQNYLALDKIDEIILCNDSCYGPISNFSDLFEKMSKEQCDFWGLTESTRYQTHLQSYFLCFRKKALNSAVFLDHFLDVVGESSVSDVILKYEVPLTEKLLMSGLKYKAYIDQNDPETQSFARINPNLTIFPLFLISRGCPLIKVKTMNSDERNYDGVVSTSLRLKTLNPVLANHILSHVDNTKRYGKRKILETRFVL